MANPLRIGLTGGIASGKSQVSAIFESLGIDVIDTDIISRELVQPGSPLLQQIVALFGTSILNKDQALNRASLRKLIFNDAKKRLQLEELLHPAIHDAVYQKISSSNSPYVVVVVPLLIETRYPYELDRILVVDTKLELQISRLTQRDQINEEEARKMLASQASREERLLIADDTIVNNADFASLRKHVEALHYQYLEASKHSEEFTYRD